jgi:hypothetical protein
MNNSTANSENNKRKRGNVANLKPFVKGDPRINRKGAPKRGQTWQETVKFITDMTREEAITYVGANTKIGKLLKELPPNVPIKEAMVLATIIHYGREPNARMFAALTDREEGKPKESIDLSNTDGSLSPKKEADDTRAEILGKLDSIAAAIGAGAVPKQSDE